MKPIVIKSHSRPLQSVVFNKDGDLLFSSAADGFVFVYHTIDGQILGKINLNKKIVTCIDCSFDSKVLICALYEKVCLFEVETGNPIGEIHETALVKHVEFCRKPLHQNMFVVAIHQFSEHPAAIKIYLFDSGRFECIWQTIDFTSQCTRAHWGPFDQTIITSHEDGSIYVWDWSTDDFFSFKAHDSKITCLNFSEDRLLMISSCTDGFAKLWDTVKFRCLKTYETDRMLNGCDISPLYKEKGDTQRQHVILGGGQKSDEVTMTAASQGKFQALVMHMIRCEEVGRCEGHFGPINTIRFMPNGRGYASGGEDGYLRIYHFDDIYFTDKLK